MPSSRNLPSSCKSARSAASWTSAAIAATRAASALATASDGVGPRAKLHSVSDLVTALVVGSTQVWTLPTAGPGPAAMAMLATARRRRRWFFIGGRLPIGATMLPSPPQPIDDHVRGVGRMARGSCPPLWLASELPENADAPPL